VGPYRDGTGFLFRFVNRRSNQLVEVEASLVLSLLDEATGARRFQTLPLERNRISLFPSNWTVVHPILPGSPLFGLDAEALRRVQAEFIVLVKAYDDTFAQTIYQRTSYTAAEVAWGGRFQPMAVPGPDGTLVMDVQMLDAVAP